MCLQFLKNFGLLQRPYMAKFLRDILPSSDCFYKLGISRIKSNGKPSPEAYTEVWLICFFFYLWIAGAIKRWQQLVTAQMRISRCFSWAAKIGCPIVVESYTFSLFMIQGLGWNQSWIFPIKMKCSKLDYKNDAISMICASTF